MQAPASEPQPRRRQWHNALPSWILDSAAYDNLRAGVRQTLQAIANAADPPRPGRDQSLLYARGGQPLVDAAGVSKGTFWRHLNRLERLGFVVTLSRGGVLRTSDGPKNLGNTYGIPGQPGALDQRRCRRELRQMFRSDADGAYRPTVVQPGDQSTLWHPADVQRRGADESEAPSQNETGGSVKTRRGSCQNETPSAPSETGKKTKAGVLRRKGAGRKRSALTAPTMTDVQRADLTDTGRTLALWTDACRRGWADASDAGRLTFVAMAEHALRKGDDPMRLFASNARRGLWLFITNEDEIAAQRRLKEYVHGPLRAPESNDTKQRREPGPRTLSADVTSVRAAMHCARNYQNQQVAAFALLRRERPRDGWTKVRFDKALAEPEGAP